MTSVYIILDMINDLVHEDGFFRTKPLSALVKSRNVVHRTAAMIKKARAAKVPVCFVRVGFSADYKEAPASSPVFDAARDHGYFRATEWGGQIHDLLKPRADEFEILKHRVSPFFSTSLDLVLRQLGATKIFLSGVSTNGVVLSAVKEGHDRDYLAYVFEDTCAAPTVEQQDASTFLIERYATVLNSESFDFTGRGHAL